MDGIDAWLVTEACFRCIAAARLEQGSPPIGRSELLDARRVVMNIRPAPSHLAPATTVVFHIETLDMTRVGASR